MLHDGQRAEEIFAKIKEMLFVVECEKFEFFLLNDIEYVCLSFIEA